MALDTPTLERILRRAGAEGWLNASLTSRSMHDSVRLMAPEFGPDLAQAALERMSITLDAFRANMANRLSVQTPEGMGLEDVQRVLNACTRLESLEVASVPPYSASVPRWRLPKTLRHLSLPEAGQYIFNQHLKNKHLTSLELRGDLEPALCHALAYDLPAAVTAKVRLPHAESALCAAIDAGDSNLVNFLLLHGLQTHGFPTRHGEILMAAGHAGGAEMVTRLLQHGLSANSTVASRGTSVLAAQVGDLSCNLDVIEALIDGGAEIEGRDAAGNTPLAAAAAFGNLPAVLHLVHRGANPNAPSSDGKSPLAAALQSDDLEVIRTLALAGAQPAREDVAAASPAAAKLLKALGIAAFW